jgi:hypothetical protein
MIILKIGLKSVCFKISLRSDKIEWWLKLLKN